MPRVSRRVPPGAPPQGDGPPGEGAPPERLGTGHLARGLVAVPLHPLRTPPARTLVIPGEWASKGNTYGITKRGGFYRKAGTAQWETLIRALAAASTPMDGPLVAAIVVRSATARKDCHNIGKALLDAGESRQRDKGTKRLRDTRQGLYHNDKQVGPTLIWPLPKGPPVTVLALWPYDRPAGAMLAALTDWILYLEARQ